MPDIKQYREDKARILDELQGRPRSEIDAAMTAAAESAGYRPTSSTAGTSEWGQTVVDQSNSPLQRPALVPTQRPNIMSTIQQAYDRRHDNVAFNEAYNNMMITGNTGDFKLQLEAGKQRTVQDELVETLISDYQDDEFRRNKLQNLDAESRY